MTEPQGQKSIPAAHPGGGQCPGHYYDVTDGELASMCGPCAALASRLSRRAGAVLDADGPAKSFTDTTTKENDK
jgi:hypothetical protein